MLCPIPSPSGGHYVLPIKKYIGYYVGLLFMAALFLLIHHQTHSEFMLHLAAIPLEVLMAVFIVERILEDREIREKRKQLRYIKSHMFRSSMRNLFLANFKALESPSLTMSDIQNAGLEELQEMRRSAEDLRYRSPDDLEPVIREYVKARRVWTEFLERAVQYNFEDIVEDMIYILNFIQDVEFFYASRPDSSYIQAAAGHDRLMTKIHNVVEDGVRKFLDYMIELKQKDPQMFDEVMDSYAFSSQLRRFD